MVANFRPSSYVGQVFAVLLLIVLAAAGLTDRVRNKLASAGESPKAGQPSNPGEPKAAPAEAAAPDPGAGQVDIDQLTPEDVARARSEEQDRELEFVHQVTNAMRDVSRGHEAMMINLRRRNAARQQVIEVESSYDAGMVTLDLVLDARRRVADAEIGYVRKLIDFGLAGTQVEVVINRRLKDLLLDAGIDQSTKKIDDSLTRLEESLNTTVERSRGEKLYHLMALQTSIKGRDEALRLWRRIYALYKSGKKGGEAAKEAQAREQYFLFRANVEDSLRAFYKGGTP